MTDETAVVQTSGQSRLSFAHMSRGVAAVLVVVSHAFGTFWLGHRTIAKLMGAPQLPSTFYSGFDWIVQYQFLIGQLGVAIFFLISGFVIPFSLEKISPIKFLMRRFLRIYPVYIAGFSVTVAMIWFVGAVTAGEFRYGAGELALHYTLLPREWLGGRIIDGVSWTLEIELIFYLFMAAAGRFILSRGFWTIAGASVVFALAGLALRDLTGNDWIGRQFASIPMLLCGVGIYLHYRGRMSLWQVIVLALLGLASTSLLFLSSVRFFAQWGQWTIGNAIAFLAFMAAYLNRDRIGNNRLASHIADISYPLYASHIFIVHGVLYLACAKDLTPWIGISIALALSYAVALALHIVVEKPSQRLLHFQTGEAIASARTRAA